MNNKRCVIAISLALFVFGLAAAFAQSATCPGADCMDQSDFNAGADGWTGFKARNTNATTITWLASKTLGLPLFWSTATGVLQAADSGGGFPSPGIRKTIFLSTGTYKVLFSAGSDGWFGADITVNAIAPDGVTYGPGAYYHADGSFKQFASHNFTVTDPGDVTIEIYSKQATLFFDYVWIVADTAVAPTFTPAAGTPSATAVPAATATPIASGTAYCIAAPTSTPTGARPYSRTPTATPLTGDSNWAVLDHFPYISLSDIWSTAGNYVGTAPNAGRNTIESGGSALIPYSVGATPVAELTRNALIYTRPASFTLPFYVDGWARDKFLPAGLSSYIEIWSLDPNYDGFPRWMQVYTMPVSSAAWYPFHVEVDEQADGSGEIVAVAFLSSRSDDAVSGDDGWKHLNGVYLDDVYIYGDLLVSPRCDGTYPSVAVDLSSSGSGSAADNNTVYINVPLGQSCPPGNIYIPNNFWGGILGQAHILFERMFAFAPNHNATPALETVKASLLSPVGILFTLTSILFDWRSVLTVAVIFIVLQGAYRIFLTWMAARYMTIE